VSYARPAGLVLTALIVAVLAACSPYDVRAPIPDMPDPPPLPPLLEFVHPYPGLVYTEVDDLEPEVPGIQLEARIQVEDLANDVWVDDIGLSFGEVERRLEVQEGRTGDRIAVGVVTFPEPEQTAPVRLQAIAGDALGRTLVEFKLAPPQ
jgi:hypothetical protein